MNALPRASVAYCEFPKTNISHTNDMYAKLPYFGRDTANGDELSKTVPLLWCSIFCHAEHHIGTEYPDNFRYVKTP